VERPTLYRGPWPQNVSKLAKYAVRFVDGQWKLTVQYEAGDGLRFLAVEGGGSDLADKVNAIKVAAQDQPGGAFYVNEYRHVVVPVRGESGSGVGSSYHFVCLLDQDFVFEFEGNPLLTAPTDASGKPLEPGCSWVGPRPGIPYVLKAGGVDIHYETPALTDDDPPAVRPMVTRQVHLSKLTGDKNLAKRAAAPVSAVRGYQGGRFYVNEHGAMFTPVDSGDGNGLDYVYCGQIDREAWFPEPPVAG
jgi:hypothetical protein